MNKLVILIVLTMLVSCTSRENGRSHDSISVPISNRGALPDTPIVSHNNISIEKNEGDREPSFTPYACSLLEKFPDSLSFLLKNANIVLQGNDSCVVSLIDTIVHSYIATGKLDYLILFDSICSVSDGYVAELVMDLNGDLLVRSTKKYMMYLYQHKDRSKLPKYLAYFFRFRSDGYESYSGENEALRNLIKQSANQLPRSHYQFLRKIVKNSGFPMT